ncbi:MAG: glycosyltransferase, partial [Burkholderiales bacterium]|nr:glycosyltransferase [Burkholderiales bacterium]
MLILQRGLTRRAWRLVEAMRRSGGRVVYEIDDLLTRMPPNLVHHAAVERGQPWLRRCLAAADIVSVSTARLARELAELAPTRWVEVPNYGGAVAPAAAAAPRIEDPPALLFASSDRVPVSAVAQALRGLRAAGVALGAVIAIGPVAADLAAAGISVDALPGLPYLEFLRYLRRLGPTLALIPVGATPFDACKSAIKFYDYALAGIPVICADRPPYSDVIEAGVDGWLVADEPEAWRAAIAQAAADPRRRARVSAAAASRVAADHGL